MKEIKELEMDIVKKRRRTLQNTNNKKLYKRNKMKSERKTKRGGKLFSLHFFLQFFQFVTLRIYYKNFDAYILLSFLEFVFFFC